MSRVEDIQKARHDVELLQHGLEKVSTVLQGAEEVAVMGERVKRRAPVILLTLAIVAVLTGGVVLLVRSRRRRDAESAQSRPG
jgi:hypothetical protein